MNVLYLEDEFKNPEIERFCDVADKNGVKIHLVNSKEELFAKIGDTSEHYPVVICDVEIWDDPDRNNKNRILSCLGFSCIKELIEEKHEFLHQYYLLTNCSKRLHGIIHNDLKKMKIPIKPKDDVFTENGLENFIQDIKKEGSRVLDSLKDTGIENEVFDAIYQYTQKHDIEELGSFNEIEEDVTRRALALIYYFEDEGYKDSADTKKTRETLIKDKSGKKIIDNVPYCNMAVYFDNNKYTGITYISAETNKFVSQDYEKRKITINDFLVHISARLGQKDVDELKSSKAYSGRNKTIVEKFMTKLILRRLAIYIHKIYSQKVDFINKISSLTDVYPYITPQDDAFLRNSLFMSGGAKYKTTIKEKHFFIKHFNTAI